MSQSKVFSALYHQAVCKGKMRKSMIYLPGSSLAPTEASSRALVDFTYGIIVFIRKKYYFPVDSSVFGQCHKYRLCILFCAFYPVAQKMQFLDLQSVQDR